MLQSFVQLDRLKDILQQIPSEVVRSMQSKITLVYRRLVWNNPAVNYDAFYSVMLELWSRRHPLPL